MAPIPGAVAIATIVSSQPESLFAMCSKIEQLVNQKLGRQAIPVIYKSYNIGGLPKKIPLRFSERDFTIQ